MDCFRLARDVERRHFRICRLFPVFTRSHSSILHSSYFYSGRLLPFAMTSLSIKALEKLQKTSGGPWFEILRWSMGKLGFVRSLVSLVLKVLNLYGFDLFFIWKLISYIHFSNKFGQAFRGKKWQHCISDTQVGTKGCTHAEWVRTFTTFVK